MFGNHDSTFAQHRSSGYHAQDLSISAVQAVRRIEKTNVKLYSGFIPLAQSFRCIALRDGTGCEAKRCEVLTQHLRRFAAGLGEMYRARATAQCLNAYGAGTRKQIGPGARFHHSSRRQHVEQRLFEPVIGRTCLDSPQAFQCPASKLSSNHSHWLFYYLPSAV